MTEPLVAGHSQAWHDQRMQGLGSSDVAAILGLSTFSTAIDVWREKKGLTEPRPDNAFFEWGRRLEPIIADAAMGATGIAWTIWSQEVHCKAWPVAFTHLDRRGRDQDGAMAALEAKSGMSTKGWGDPSTVSIAEAHLVVPGGYAIQCAHHLLCTGYARVYLAALLGYRDFRVYRIERDESYLDDLLADEQAWWQHHIVDGNEPEPDGSEAYRKHLAARHLPPVSSEEGATPEQQLIAARALAAKRRIKEAEGQYELEKQRLDVSLGGRTSLRGPGWRATRTKGRSTIAWQAVVGEVAPIDADVQGAIARNTKVGDPGFTITEEE